jgi:hypothetical protein
MNKKILSGLAAIALISGACALPNAGTANARIGIFASADTLSASETTQGSKAFTYTLSTDKTAVITKYSGTEATVEIPESLDGYTVTAIGDNAFNGHENLTKITIPDSVTSIGAGAFENCSALTEVSISRYVTKLGDKAFGYREVADDSDETVVTAVKVDGFKILCVKNTAAERYAENNDFSYDAAYIDISTATITASAQSFVYTGKAIKPTVTVTNGTDTLKSGTDYTVTYENNTNAGTATVKISGAGSFSGSATAQFTITAADFTKAEATLDKTSYTYSGTAFKPAVTVKLGTTVLKSDTDYSVAYTDNTNAGTATVTITGKGNYSGTLTKTFKISSKSISKAKASIPKASYTYSGKALKPTVTVKLGDKKLVSGTDYKVTYKNNTNVGTATITVTGKGNYSGTLTKTFKVTSKSISKAKATIPKASYTYTGKAIKPTVTVKLNGKKLKNGTDYKITYKNNTKAGTATIVVTGKGNYTGTVKRTFKITQKSISNVKATIPKATYTYTGKAIKPTVTVKLDKTKLKNGTDYTVSYKNNTKAGTATIVITGKGNYKGTFKRTFKIKTASLSSAKISGISSYYKYLGTERTPTPKITFNGKTLKSGTDYTVSYSNNVNIGTATVTIKGKGSFTGTVKKTFKIVRMGWSTVSGLKYYYTENGSLAVGLTTIGDDTYYFNSKGVMQTSWQKLNGSYYFFNRTTGKRVVGSTVDGIAIAADGTVQKTDYNVSKIDTMITAHNLVEEITNPTDSMETKRLKCFKWVFQFPYHRFRLLSPIYQNEGWEITFANDIFKSKAGCCVSEASAVAFLFHECGYETVYVAHDTGHAWVELNGRVFDPLFAEARSFSDNYNVLVPKGVYRSNPVQRRKI